MVIATRNFESFYAAYGFAEATGDVIREELMKFRNVENPFRIRVEWFCDEEPLDAEVAPRLR